MIYKERPIEGLPQQPHVYSDGDYTFQCAEQGNFLWVIALFQKQQVGWATFECVPGEVRLILHNVITREEHRRKGIGKGMIETAKRQKPGYKVNAIENFIDEGRIWWDKLKSLGIVQ